MDTSNVQNGLNSAKDGIMSIIKFAVNNVAVPIIAAGLLGLLVFLISSAATKHRMGEDYSHRIFEIIGCVIVLALIATFPAWGWKLIGQ